MFWVLPVALLLALPVFSEPTSTNDPFRAIAFHFTKPPRPPICCLKPPAEPVEDDLLLSFEEWKTKQLMKNVDDKAKANEKDSPKSAASNGGGAGGSGGQVATEPQPPDGQLELPSKGTLATSQDLTDTPSDETISPHFRVPLTDRFNYASTDCSARVHTSHRSAQSSAAILSSKKDKYMLSPCASSRQEKQYIVVELCEDIRLDTVQLANFEFFSGVFKDFTVSVAKTYTTDAEGWVRAGTYKAKNVRGVQSFHPPTSLRDFYRYIRIDFHSHYGNEYYCPISLLRVYGLTHLEQWKWDMWEAESRAKREDSHVVNFAAPAEVVEEAQKPVGPPMTESSGPQVIQSNATVTAVIPLPDINETDKSVDTSSELKTTVTKSWNARNVSGEGGNQHSTDMSVSSTTVDLSSAEPHSSATAQAEDPTLTFSDDSSSSITHHVVESHGEPQSAESLSPITVVGSPISTDNPSSLSSVSLSAPAASTLSNNNSLSLPSQEIPASGVTDSSHSASLESQPSQVSSERTEVTTITPSVISNNSTRVTTALPSRSSSNLSVPASLPSPTGGESIYRTIMNRLSALETNHTLYARYVEEQTASVREMLRRFGEDLGRLEGIGKAQAQMYQRTMQEWRITRDRLEYEHDELLSRVEYLADEIVLEKRLGLAQLCLLLAVLVFMGLTRGSRGESFINHGGFVNQSMREWGRRTLSFRGDWVSRLRSRSLTSSVGKRTRGQENGTVKLEFPAHSPIRDLQDIHPDKRLSDSSVTRAAVPKPRSRTPSSHRTPRRLGLQQAVTPAGGQVMHHRQSASASARLRPQIQRAASSGMVIDTGSPYGPGFGFGGLVSAPRSAKKWARSAHLHEVRGKRVTPRREEEERGTVRSPLREKENNPKANRDVFSAASLENGNGKDLTMLSEGIHPLKFSRRNSIDDANGDPWVDTDVDGSEADSDSVICQSPVVAMAPA